MTTYDDRESFLDALYDYIFPESDYPDGPDDEDEKFFEHVSKFFPESEPQGGSDKGTGGTNPPRRRRSSGQSSAPRRRRRQAASSTASGYGNSTFFGTK
jgi:hypothetical protein